MSIQILGEYSDVLEEFNSQRCFVFDTNEKFLSEGILSIMPSLGFGGFFTEVKGIDKTKEKENININVKNMHNQLSDGTYVIKSIIYSETENKYFKLHIKEQAYNSLGSILKSKAKIEVIHVFDSNESEYTSFSKQVYVYEWDKILIPKDCAGSGPEDAFEDLCLKLIDSWGGKTITKTGKGPDSGRDGQFLIEMDSWIPMITGYSTRWVLQCKYSKDRRNLEKAEIYRDMVKALEFQPDYFLLMTNRNFSDGFEKWFNSDLMKQANYFIPFKKIIIQRELLEIELSKPRHEMLRKKYFG